MCDYNLDIPSRYGFLPGLLTAAFVACSASDKRGGENGAGLLLHIFVQPHHYYTTLSLISSVHGLPLTTMQVLTDIAVRINVCLLASRQTKLLLLQLCRGHDLQPEGGDGVPSTLPPFHFSSAPRITCSLPHLNHWKSSVQSCTLYHSNPIT